MYPCKRECIQYLYQATQDTGNSGLLESSLGMGKMANLLLPFEFYLFHALSSKKKPLSNVLKVKISTRY